MDIAADGIDLNFKQGISDYFFGKSGDSAAKTQNYETNQYVATFSSEGDYKDVA
jgi:hypothetical protein